MTQIKIGDTFLRSELFEKPVGNTDLEIKVRAWIETEIKDI